MNTSRTTTSLSASFCKVRSRIIEARINPEDLNELEVTKARNEAKEYKRRNEELLAELARLKAAKTSPEKSLIRSPLKRLKIKRSSENANPNIPRRLPTQESEEYPQQLRTIIEERNRENLMLKSQVSSLQLRVMTLQTKHMDELDRVQQNYRQELRTSRRKIRDLSAQILCIRERSKHDAVDFTLSDDETSSDV